MPSIEYPLVRSRSDRRIPKLRTRGRANRERLLTVAQDLIEEYGSRPIRFSDVFEAAGVSRGSAYRIYNGVDDLMQDLVSSWINEFVRYVKEGEALAQPESWGQLSDHLVAKASQYWDMTSDTLRVLPRVRSNVPESYRVAVKDLTRAFSETFETYFEVPEVPDWLAVLGMYISLGDTIFADAVRREGHISEKRLHEAQAICRAYLAFYLPEQLPAKIPNST